MQEEKQYLFSALGRNVGGHLIGAGFHHCVTYLPTSVNKTPASYSTKQIPLMTSRVALCHRTVTWAPIKTQLQRETQTPPTHPHRDGNLSHAEALRTSKRDNP